MCAKQIAILLVAQLQVWSTKAADGGNALKNTYMTLGDFYSADRSLLQTSCNREEGGGYCDGTCFCNPFACDDCGECSDTLVCDTRYDDIVYSANFAKDGYSKTLFCNDANNNGWYECSYCHEKCIHCVCNTDCDSFCPTPATDSPSLDPTSDPTLAPSSITDEPTRDPTEEPTEMPIQIERPVEACNEDPTDPCDCNDDEFCKICHYPDGPGCSQCKNRFFKFDYNYPCVKCTDIFEGCKFCQDFIGCAQCKNTYLRMYDDKMAAYSCVDCRDLHGEGCRVCEEQECKKCRRGYKLITDEQGRGTCVERA